MLTTWSVTWTRANDPSYPRTRSFGENRKLAETYAALLRGSGAAASVVAVDEEAR